MIVVEGYKAFIGVMIIKPKGSQAQPFYGDWLYKPLTNCWYMGGVSFPAEVCTVGRDDTKHLGNEVV